MQHMLQNVGIMRITVITNEESPHFFFDKYHNFTKEKRSPSTEEVYYGQSSSQSTMVNHIEGESPHFFTNIIRKYVS